jgi:hypothetical protein
MKPICQKWSCETQGILKLVHTRWNKQGLRTAKVSDYFEIVPILTSENLLEKALAFVRTDFATADFLSCLPTAQVLSCKDCTINQIVISASYLEGPKSTGVLATTGAVSEKMSFVFLNGANQDTQTKADSLGVLQEGPLLSASRE